MSKTLDLVNVISVSIQGAPSNLNLPLINTVALFSKDTPSGWGGSEVYRIYTNPTNVATDFGTGSNAYKIATAFFAQQPNPLNTGGYLVIIPRTSGGSETVEAAIARTTNLVYYFGVLVDELLDGTELDNLADAVQSLDKMVFYASDTAADYAPGGMLDDLRTASQTHTRGLFYDGSSAIETQQFAAAYAARALSTDFAGSLTTQTMHLKTLANISPDPTIDQTELNKCQTAGVDVYINIAGVPSLFTSGENMFFDEVYNEFWLKFALQTAGFNYLRGTSTKIAQTETGIEGLKTTYRKICEQAVNNGFIGPGAWTSPDVFGNAEALVRSVKDIGYYVYALPVSQQSTADRDDRKAPTIQIAIKARGAVHSSNVIVRVNL